MECVLLLEFFINKNWLNTPEIKLLNALPNAHFAVRCATLSSVSLRIFCIDKALAYDKVQTASRGSRSGAVGGSESRTANTNTTKRKSVPVTTTSSRSRGRPRLDEEEGSIAKRTLGRRAATRQNYAEPDTDDEDEVSGRRRLRERKTSSTSPSTNLRLQPWECSSCHEMNEARSRSCSECGTSKPPASMAYPSSRPSRQDRMRERQRAQEEEEEEDEDEDEDEEEEEEEEEDSRGPVLRIRKTRGMVATRASSRNTNKRMKYTNDDEDEEEEDEEEEEKEEEEEENEDDDDKDDDKESENEMNTEESESLSDMIYRIIEETEDEGKLIMLRILQALVEDSDSEVFHTPVDEKEVPGYRKVIKSPMDLRSITTQVAVNFYGKSGEDYDSFLQDLALIWKNCQQYNGLNSSLTKCAQRLSARVDQLAHEHGILSE